MSPKPLFPWIGGKTRLSKKIIPLFPAHTCYCEPFAGAAGIFFAKEPSKVEVLNDINGDLINLYRVVQNHLEEFVKQFKWLLTSRQQFNNYKQSSTELLTDIQRAARFYYLQKNAFGGHVENQTFGISPTRAPRLNLLRIEEELSMGHLRLSGIYAEHLAWDKCIERYDREETLFFCDPPYFKTAGYGVSFGMEQYQKMAELAKSIKGKMVITVNDCPEMREVFSDPALHIATEEINYTCGNNRKQPQKKATELIILNYQQ